MPPPRLRPCHGEIFDSLQCRYMASIPKLTTETYSKGFVAIGTYVKIMPMKYNQV